MNIVLETKRLLLREWESSDAPEMYLLNSDPEVIKYTGDVPFKNVEETKQLILNYDHYEKFKMGRLTVLLKETNEYLGWCGLKYLVDMNEVELGYRFHKKYWGNGYATEACIACLEYGFENLKLKRIIGQVLKENVASVRVLEKIGMHFEKEEIFHDAPGVVYSIEKKQFKPEQGNF